MQTKLTICFSLGNGRWNNLRIQGCRYGTVNPTWKWHVFLSLNGPVRRLLPMVYRLSSSSQKCNTVIVIVLKHAIRAFRLSLGEKKMRFRHIFGTELVWWYRTLGCSTIWQCHQEAWYNDVWTQRNARLPYLDNGYWIIYVYIGLSQQVILYLRCIVNVEETKSTKLNIAKLNCLTK